MKKIYFALGLMVATFGANAQGDDCATAVPVTVGSHVADGPGSGGGSIGSGTNADWYSFTATCSGTIDVSSCASGGTDTDLYIYENSCPVLSSEAIAANDDACGFSSELNGVSVTAGNTYYIEWTDFWVTSGFNWDLGFTLGGISNVTTANTTFSSTDVDWDPAGAETDWVFEYGVAGFSPGSGTIWNVSVASDTSIIGLLPETSYEYYVSTTGPCASTAGPFSFTTAAVCPVPTLTSSAPTISTSMLDWTAGGTETMWDVEYGMNGFPLGTGTPASGIMLGSDTTVTGLTGDTDYHWYVRAVCDLVMPYDTMSFWVGPESFTTLPVCTEPNTLSTTSSDGFNADLTWAPGGLELEWNIQWGFNGFVLNGTGANIINANTTLTESLSGLIPNEDYCYYVQSVCGSTADSLSGWVGPFCWTQPNYCNDPSNGVFSNLTTTSVDFDWTAGGIETDWTVEYGQTGFTLGTGTQVMTTNTTTSVTGLITNTEYCFYVQSNCGSTADSSSAWVGPFCVTTIPTCPQPTNLGVMNVTVGAANLIWQAGASETSWNVEWGSTGFNPGNSEELGSVSATSDNPYYATGLSGCGTYEFYVQAFCGVADESSWSGPFSFSTLAGTVTAPYMESFDAALATPNCWSNLGPGENWAFQSSGGGGPDYGLFGSIDHTSGTGNYTWIDASGSIGANELVSPMIDFSGLTTPYVGFWLLSNNIDDVAQNNVRVEGWNGTAWTIIGTYEGNNSEWVKVEFVIPGTMPTTTQFRLIQEEGTNGGSAFYNDLLVDDFYVVDGIACSVDAGTAVSGGVCSSDGSVDLFDAITGYTLDNGTWYYPSATDPGAQSFASNSGTMVLTGLVEGTDYTFDYVVTGCENDTVSVVINWSQQPSAGGDGSLTTCNTSDIILIQELNGSISMGGSWTDVDGASGLSNGVFSSNGVAGGTYNFEYVVGSGSCSDTSNVVITLTDCSGLNTDEVSSLLAYPNPVQNVLTISNLNIQDDAQIILINVQGQVVYTDVITNVIDNYELDMSGFENGVYFVRVTNETSTQEVRIVKQ